MEFIPDVFTCERFRCTMRREECVSRQTKMIRTQGAFLHWHFQHQECKNCSQGELIRNTKLGERKIMDEKKTAGVKKCNECGETKPLDAFTKSKAGHLGRRSKCKVCESARAHKYWLKKKELLWNTRTAVEREKTGKITKEKTNDQLKLILDLYGYEEVMEALEEQARINIRTPAGQALYYVVAALKRDSNNVSSTSYPQN